MRTNSTGGGERVDEALLPESAMTSDEALKAYLAPKPPVATCPDCGGKEGRHFLNCWVWGRVSPTSAPQRDDHPPEGLLRRLYHAYVVLLETGRDRIITHGGQCDDVPTMEANDPILREVRAALAASKDKPDMAPPLSDGGAALAVSEDTQKAKSAKPGSLADFAKNDWRSGQYGEER